MEFVGDIERKIRHYQGEANELLDRSKKSGKPMSESEFARWGKYADRIKELRQQLNKVEV